MIERSMHPEIPRYDVHAAFPSRMHFAGVNGGYELRVGPIKSPTVIQVPVVGEGVSKQEGGGDNAEVSDIS